MSTYRITASAASHVKNISSSEWYDTGAAQGVYGKNASPRLGAILFSGLHDIDWSSQLISSVTLIMTFPKAGYSSIKTIGLHKSTRSDIGGVGSDMRGDEIGYYNTNSKAYNATITNVFNSENNPSVFEGLVSWLQDGTSPILVTFIDEANPYASYSKNYAVMRSIAMEIEYEPAGSDCVLDSAEVLAGSTIACSITPISAEGVVTHAVQWVFDGASSDLQQLGSDLSATYTVPLDWLHQIPNANIGTAYCNLTTYVDGVENAVRSLPFSVIMPDYVVPSFEYSIMPSGTTGGYYQYLGGASISFVNASSMYGASITSYGVVGSEGFSDTGETVFTEKFSEYGMHSYTLTVVDSRNRATTQTIDIDVVTVVEPLITAFDVKRYSAYVDDLGETVYADDMGGGFIWVTLDATVDLAGGNNIPSAYIMYGRQEDDADALTRVDIAWDASQEKLSFADNRSIISASIPLDSSFSFTLFVNDNLTSVTSGAQVEKSWAPMHVSGSGYGVAFGGYSSATSDTPSVRSFWPIYAMTGGRLDEAYANEETLTGSSWVDLKPIYRKIITLTVTAANVWFTSSGDQVIDNVDAVIRYELIAECGNTIHCGEGYYDSNRYYRGYIERVSGDSTKIQLAYWASDEMYVGKIRAIVYYTKLDGSSDEDNEEDETLTYVTYPAEAMTSNSSQDCVASASSVYSSSFPAYYAFDNSRANAWAAKTTDAAPWIQLQLPRALKNISVKVYDWDYSNNYQGDPASGTVMGSNDGANWVQIGSYSGWNDSSGGLLGEIVCNNAVAYSYVRLNIASMESGKTYVSVGYITITGGVPV